MEFKKYHKIKVIGDEENKELLSNPDDLIVIEEKMDGGNFRFVIINGKIIMDSRTRELDEDNKNIKNFKRCIEHIRSNLETKDLSLYEGFIFYGECMISHTMQYDWENIPPFLGFDIYNNKLEKFIEFDAVLIMYKQLGLDMVPIIEVKPAKDIKQLTDDDVPDSKYYAPSAKDKKAEGIVLKNYKRQVMAKYVRDKFKEKCKDIFGKSKKFARLEEDDELIIAIYCTNARIDKIIFKLIDEGYKLEMKMMEKLPKEVINDIYEEHWKEICFSNWSVNFRNIKKRITKRCLEVLKQVMVNNAINKSVGD